MADPPESDPAGIDPAGIDPAGIDPAEIDPAGIDPAEIDARIDRATARPFGRRFHLRGRERATAQLRGPRTMRLHASEIVAERLAAAEPRNDGRQTPYRNHPVFVAQHATATCCRTCLETWHDIPQGRALDREQRAYVVEVIGRWIDRELAAPRTSRG